METPNSYILKVSNLSVKFPSETILDNISFELKKATTLAIVGPNGAGKTTLFRAFLNLVPYDGKVEWVNKVKIGYVPQRLSVSDIPISVKEFLSFKSTSDLENSLNSVGLDSGILNKSLGILSGGQLQRVLIAWAIIDKPNVLLFDEPTAGVDLDSEEAIYGMLSELKKKNEITILLISHDTHIIREYSDYMLALNKCMTFFGESKEIVKPDIQRIVYGAPICVEHLR
jgi:zinc transport system ATP-binding protein